LLPTADEFAYIRRQDLRNPDLISYIQVNLNRDKDFILRPGDRLNIYDKSIYSLSKSLKITGSVNQPTTFTFDDKLTIADLIRMSGGLKLASAKNRVDIFRLKYDNFKGTGYDKITIELDSNLQVKGANSSIKLAPFDIIVVRDLPMFDLNRSVQIVGQVFYPGTYPLEPSRIHFSQLVKKAGGLNVLADVENGVIIRTVGKKGQIGFNPRKALKNEGNERHDPILLAGDIIEIAILQNTVGIRLRATREADLLNAGVEVGESDENQIRYFTYRGKKSAKWYLRNLAGGFGEKADKNSVTVLYPDGSVVGTRRYVGVFRDYPTLKPGSIVSLTYKNPKPAGEKKKIDVDALYTRTLTSVTTILTLIILARQL
jgi:protein involved in polysaccharide export with SLBB domain